MIPGLGRSPGERKGYPFQHSGLENSRECIVHGVTESDTTEQLSLSLVKNLPAKQETWVPSLGRKIPWRRKWHPTPVLLPGESHAQRSMAGCSPWGRKGQDMTEHVQTKATLEYLTQHLAYGPFSVNSE